MDSVLGSDAVLPHDFLGELCGGPIKLGQGDPSVAKEGPNLLAILRRSFPFSQTIAQFDGGSVFELTSYLRFVIDERR
jgi:hypothetical protein